MAPLNKDEHLNGRVDSNVSYKFILDSNAIDRISVPKMEKAGIIDACESGRFNFYMTHPLLREKFHFTVTGKALPRETAECLSFLTKIKWAGFLNCLNGKDGILNMELNGLLENEYLLTKNGEEIFKPQLSDLINGKLFPEEIRKMLEEDNGLWKKGKEKLRKNALSKRPGCNKLLALLKDVTPEFEAIWEKEKFRNKIIQHYIPLFFNRINPEVSSGELINLWNKRKNNCKWTENYIKLHYFQQWYLTTSKADPKKDINAADDIEHMIYLLYVDGMVSNETSGFMSNAKRLFPEKEILSVDDFCKKLKKFSYKIMRKLCRR